MPIRIAVEPCRDGYLARVTDPGDGRRVGAGSRAFAPTKAEALQKLGRAFIPPLWADLTSAIDPDFCAS